MSETQPDSETEARFLKAIGKALGTPARKVPPPVASTRKPAKRPKKKRAR